MHHGDHMARVTAPGRLGEHLADLAASAVPGTVAKRKLVVEAVERAIGHPIEVATEAQVRAWWRRTTHYALATRVTYVSHLRGYCLWLVAEGLREDDPTRRCARPRRPRRLPRSLDPATARAAVARMDGLDRLMCELGLGLGLRRAEIAGVRPDRDLMDDLSGAPRLTVRGKGRSERRVPVPQALAERLREAAPRGWLLPSPGSQTGHLTPDHVGRRIGDALRSAGLAATSHQLRHTFAQLVYETTRDIAATGATLGHRSLATTQVYAHAAPVDPAVIDRVWHIGESHLPDDMPAGQHELRGGGGETDV